MTPTAIIVGTLLSCALILCVWYAALSIDRLGNLLSMLIEHMDNERRALDDAELHMKDADNF